MLMVADTVRINFEETIKQTKEKIKKFQKEILGYAYECNPDYKKLLQLREKYPDKKYQTQV